MANTLKFGNGNWAYKEGKVLAYNDENQNFKPLPFDFTRASSATRVNKEGIIEEVKSGIPRIDYLNDINGALLLEPSRTNLNTFSDDFSDWTISNTTKTSNQTTSPIGIFTADLIEATNSSHYIYKIISVSSSTVYSFSYFLKWGTKNNVKIALYDATNAVFISTDANKTVIDYGNGWYRLIASFTTSPTCTSVRVYLDRESGIGTFYAWGVQLEEGNYPTSYIPTNGTTVTRITDESHNIAPFSLVGSNQGTFFIDLGAFQSNNYGSSTFSIALTESGSTSNAIGFVSNQTTNSLRGRITDVTTGDDYIGGSFVPAVRNKMALKWDGTTVSLFINGSLYASILNATARAYDYVYLPNVSRAGLYPINGLQIYNTALTDAELIALTTL